MIKQVSSKPVESSYDVSAATKGREAQEAEAALYNSTRLLPTIQDPKIYSVRVRVRLVPSVECSVVLKCKLFCLLLTNTLITSADVFQISRMRLTSSLPSGQVKNPSSTSKPMMKRWFAGSWRV